ncbi:ribonuclease HII [Patescibacteria group bacterium]|nr:ribonuclease HII [Patescibacteria group bacterium]MBU4481145.1 ribonuclease HII [Patescibacteria group bacterium]
MIKNPKHEARNSKQILISKSQIQNSLEFRILNLNIVSDFGFRISDLKLRDSKKLSPKAREKFYKILTTHPKIEWGIGRVSEKVIDKINILEATKLAMIKAIKNLGKKLQRAGCHQFYHLNGDRWLSGKVDFLILDGNFKIDVKIPQKSIIKGDEKVFSCAAASILAKVWRDKIMKRYHKKYPQYGFAQHKGYPTKKHRAMLKKYGPSAIHRLTFEPVKSILI